MTADVVVVGSGIAGLFFALRAAVYADVVILTKKSRPESSTNYAQGGIAAVFGEDDSPEMHIADTLVAGAGLCHRDAVRALVHEGPRRVRELIDLGARFTRDGDQLSLGREGGHSRRRIVRADDLTGREIERALLHAVAEHPRIRLLEDHTAIDLLPASAPGAGAAGCRGITALAPEGGAPLVFGARAVVLATGGCGQVYRHTTNPAIATGDGVAMAFRAGARIANMEFVQFHPTALYPASERSFLISEAVRGEGAVLLRMDGTPFMDTYHPRSSLAPRDIVARAIDRELKQTGDPYVLLDCSRIPAAEIRARFPNIQRETATRGIDMLRDPLPVVPAAHYLCGGVLTDTHGRSSLPGLFAIGETACTGVHGANRLASNSLLEALVFADRAARRLQQELGSGASTNSAAPELPASRPRAPVGSAAPAREEIRTLMWELVGIVRSDERLARARAQLSEIARREDALSPAYATDPEHAELRNLLQCALLIVDCARSRAESRGLHYTTDYPFRDNEHFLRDTIVVD